MREKEYRSLLILANVEFPEKLKKIEFCTVMILIDLTVFIKVMTFITQLTKSFSYFLSEILLNFLNISPV